MFECILFEIINGYFVNVSYWWACDCIGGWVLVLADVWFLSLLH